MGFERGVIVGALSVAGLWASPGAVAGAADALSRDALFADEATVEAKPAPAWKGFVQAEVARTYADPEHNSKGRLRLDLSRQGQFSETVKWKIGGRFDYDAAYDRSNFYPAEVRRDQRGAFVLRENYIDIGAGDWDFRLGRQHIVWGEMVGLYFADVVSARDLREFILPEFDKQRIPQWALRAEYFKDNWHTELVWIPLPSFDEIGKPGADFYPYPLPTPPGTVIRNEDRPARKLANSNYGLRLSSLRDGWDVSGFFYHSLDVQATFYRDVVFGAAPTLIYSPRHDPIDQLGATLAKDLDGVVVKGEAVYTRGRRFNVTRLSQPHGLVAEDTLDYALGVDLTPADDTRLNLQLFQRYYADYDADTLQDRRESGLSLLLRHKLAAALEGQVVLIHSLNRNEWLLRPQLNWNFVKNWRLLFGADVFKGPPTGFFGRYDRQDRIYSELRYSF